MSLKPAASSGAGIRRLVMAVAALLLPAVPAAAQYYQYDTVGGDDRLVITDTNLLYSPSMDIAENGDIYVAVAAASVAGGPGPEIRVYRSQDAGDSWPLWGTIFLAVAPAVAIDYPCLHIGEGTQNRVYVAFRYRGPADSNFSIMVASAPLADATATWTWQQAMAQAGVDFQSPSLDSDESSNAGYRLYLAAMGSGTDGGDVWFARSADFNGSWENEYQIFSSTTNDQMVFPEIRYGQAGVVHCVCYYNPTTSVANDMAVRYRRAASLRGEFGRVGAGRRRDLEQRRLRRIPRLGGLAPLEQPGDARLGGQGRRRGLPAGPVPRVDRRGGHLDFDADQRHAGERTPPPAGQRPDQLHLRLG